MNIKTLIKSNWPVSIGIFALLVGYFLVSAGGQQAEEALQNATAAEAPADLVEAITVGSPKDRYNIKASGRLKAQNELAVIGEVNGKVVYLNPLAKTGGRLKKGDTILRIDASTYEADLDQATAVLASAQANHVKAEADLERIKGLFDNGNVSKAALDASIAAELSSNASVKQAKAQQTRAKEMLDRTTIIAPFDSIVLAETVSLGTYVSPGVKLLDLMDEGTAEVAISLPKNQVQAVGYTYLSNDRQPIPVKAIPDSGSVGSVELNGYLRRISPIIDANSRTATIIAEFDDVFHQNNAGLAFGEDFISVSIEVQSEQPVYEIPEGAVRRNSYVWVVNGGNKIEKQTVEIVAASDGIARIRSNDALEGKKIMLTNLAEEISGKVVRINN